jgi:CTP:phosphocholine cytidylyltransferase-like protein
VGQRKNWFDPLPGNIRNLQLKKGFAMTLTKILSRTAANVSRLALKAAGIAMVGFVLCPAAAHAQGGIPLWTNRYNGPGNGADLIYSSHAVAVDSSNNVIVTGSSTGIGSGYDYATIKYSSAGVPLWTNRYNGPVNGDDEAYAMAVDGSNNVIVTGYSTGSGSGLDYATVKYSSAGVPLWTNRYNGPVNSNDTARAVAVDSSNNVIVAGSSTGSGSGLDYATIQYSSAGVPLWTNRYNGPGNGNDFAIAVAVDGSNNVIVTGQSFDSGSGQDYATIKYSSAGMPLWTNRYNGPGNGDDEAFAMAVDSSNNVIVTGGSYYGTDGEYATIQYSSAGIPLWTNHFGAFWNVANAMAVDGSNNVIVTGESNNGANHDYATVKYSSAGLPLWTNRYNGPGNYDDYVYSVTVDGSNNVIVTGESYNNGVNSDYATIQYSSTGVPLWTNRYNGTGNGRDSGISIAVDHSNNVIVTGDSVGSGGDYDFDYATIKYSRISLSPIALNFQTAGNQMVLSWANAAFGLQSAPAVTGTFTNISGAASPFTNPISGGQQFFRLQGN